MDDTLQAIILAFIFVVVAPWVASKRIARKRKKLAKTPKVVAICPYCQAEIGLQMVRNYICGNCKKTVVFFKNFKTREPLDDIETIHCPNCNTLNYNMLKFCLKCKHELH